MKVAFINTAIAFIVLSLILYVSLFFIPKTDACHIKENQYYDFLYNVIVGYSRFLFTLGTLSIVYALPGERCISLFSLKAGLIFLVGFLFIRNIFNFLYSVNIGGWELVCYILWVIFNIHMIRKKYLSEYR